MAVDKILNAPPITWIGKRPWNRAFWEQNKDSLFFPPDLWMTLLPRVVLLKAYTMARAVGDYHGQVRFLSKGAAKKVREFVADLYDTIEDEGLARELYQTQRDLTLDSERCLKLIINDCREALEALETRRRKTKEPGKPSDQSE
jgi:hypothetical protein